MLGTNGKLMVLESQYARTLRYSHSMKVKELHYYLTKCHLQVSVYSRTSVAQTDGSFTMAVLNSFLSP